MTNIQRTHTHFVVYTTYEFRFIVNKIALLNFIMCQSSALAIVVVMYVARLNVRTKEMNETAFGWVWWGRLLDQTNKIIGIGWRFTPSRQMNIIFALTASIVVMDTFTDVRQSAVTDFIHRLYVWIESKSWKHFLSTIYSISSSAAVRVHTQHRLQMAINELISRIFGHYPVYIYTAKQATNVEKSYMPLWGPSASVMANMWCVGMNK